MSNLIILSSGYSVREGIDLGLWHYIKNTPIMTCNYSSFTINDYKYSIPYKPKLVCWTDSTFYDENKSKIDNLHCIKSTVKHEMYNRTNINQYNVYNNPHAFRIQDKMYVGGSRLTGIFAISLALYLGYTKLYLLGYDDGRIGDNPTHYYYDSLELNHGGIGDIKPYTVYNNSKYMMPFVNLCKTDKYRITIVGKSNFNILNKITYKQFFREL